MYLAFSVQQGILNRPTDHRRRIAYFPSSGRAHLPSGIFGRERELIRLMFDDQTDSRIIILTHLPTSSRLFRPVPVPPKKK